MTISLKVQLKLVEHQKRDGNSPSTHSDNRKFFRQSWWKKNPTISKENSAGEELSSYVQFQSYRLFELFPAFVSVQANFLFPHAPNVLAECLSSVWTSGNYDVSLRTTNEASHFSWKTSFNALCLNAISFLYTGSYLKYLHSGLMYKFSRV